MFRKLRRKIVRLAFVSGAGAAATYFFDRERGVERREQAKAKAASLLGRQSATPADWESAQANRFDTAPVPSAPVTSAPVPPAAPASAPAGATVTDITGVGTVDVLVAESGPVTAP